MINIFYTENSTRKAVLDIIKFIVEVCFFSLTWFFLDHQLKGLCSYFLNLQLSGKVQLSWKVWQKLYICIYIIYKSLKVEYNSSK